MKLLAIALLISFTFATLHPVNHEIVGKIKQLATTWTPMEPEENPFAYMSVEEIKSMMGTKLNPTKNMVVDFGVTPNDSFDAREKWQGKIHDIRSQGVCGGCWAFGAAGALSDRFAISGTDVILSPQYLISCDEINFGCSGGDLHRAWQFVSLYGIVTEACYPYSSAGGFSGFCKSKCNDGSDFKRYFSGSVIETANVDTIKQAIMTGGPVEASFVVYSDFMNYKEGIYQHTGEGELMGGHAVKAVGWGTENNVDYWIMANSWGPKWGDKGYFKIKMGDCKIDEEVVFADVKLNSE